MRTPAPVAGVASGSIAARAAQVASVLRDPKDEPQLDSCMQQLELDARHNDFRQALRAALAGSDHGAPRIVELVAPSYVPDMFERLVIVLFGPELVDLETPSGVDQAARLVRDVDDDELVAVLARLTKTHGRLRRIAPALGMRWAERAGADAPEHGPVFAALAVVGRLFRVRSSTWQQRIFLTGWVLVLVFALGFGFFAGRTAAVPTVTAPLTPPPSAPPSAPERPREMTFGGSQVAGSFQNGSAEARGTVQNLPDGDQLRLLEGRTDQSGKIVYYLQPGPCAVADGAWLCRQSAPVPQAKRRDSSTVVVVHADPAVAAFAELDKNRKPDADAVRLEELPAGTATVVQQQP